MLPKTKVAAIAAPVDVWHVPACPVGLALVTYPRGTALRCHGKTVLLLTFFRAQTAEGGGEECLLCDPGSGYYT